MPLSLFTLTSICTLKTSQKTFIHNMSKSNLRFNLAIFHYVEKIKPYFLKKFVNKLFLKNGKKEHAEKLFQNILYNFNQSLLKSNFYTNFLLYKAYPFNLYFRYKYNIIHFYYKKVEGNNQNTYLNKSKKFYGLFYNISAISLKSVLNNSTKFLRRFSFLLFFNVRLSNFCFFFKHYLTFFSRKRDKKYLKGIFRGITLKNKLQLRNLNKIII